MLAPDSRQSLLDALRPPAGYHVGCAVGTTFSVDLDAALTPPAAFAMHAVKTGNREAGIEPLELLDSIRRHADKYTIFFQAGQVAVPAQRRLFAYLEGALVPVVAPQGGVFHPKVWVLRFESPDDAPRFRMLCASRNLTYDRAWDTILRLDSATDEDLGADAPVIDGEGLASFLRALPGLAVSGLSPARLASIETLAAQTSAVRWSAPPWVEAGRFHPIGLGSGHTPPFPERAHQVAVVSPFLTPGLLKRLPQATKRSALISRPDQIKASTATVSQVFGEVYTLDPDAVPVPAHDPSVPNGPAPSHEDPSIPFDGLHAKLFVFDDGQQTTLLSGSANATTAAFSTNVEFLTELRGPQRVFGVDVLLAEPSRGVQPLRSFLMPMDMDGLDPIDHGTPPPDTLDQLRRRLGALPLTVTATPQTEDSTGSERFLLQFTSAEKVPDLGDGVSWRCWPITLPSAAQVAAESIDALTVDFTVSFEGITAFLANELTYNGETTRFVLTADMTTSPPDRGTRLLRLLLGDAERFLRYLLLLLSDDVVDQLGFSDMLDALEGGDDERWKVGAASLPLLEAMLRTLARDPARLDQINRLLTELRSGDPEADEPLVPEGLLEIWEPIWAVARELQS